MNYYVLDETVASNLCWDSATYTSEHKGPDPKLNGRNESENCFFPHQEQLSSNIHLEVHHKPVVSAPFTDTRKHKTAPGLWGVWARGRCSEDDAQLLLHGPVSPQEMPQQWELWMLCQHLLVCIRTTQATTADKMEPQRSCKQKWSLQSSCCLGRNSLCLGGHSIQAITWL